MLAGPEEELQGRPLILQGQDKTSAAVSALLEHLIDYAGLFPPAGLSMREAVRNYAAYRAGEDRWALERFVLPVARFDEFLVELRDLPGHTWPWHISALLGADWPQDCARVQQLFEQSEGRAVVDSIEVKIGADASPAALRAMLPREIPIYCELDPPDWSRLNEIHDAGLRAKIRTGGVIESAIPSTESVADFLLACSQLQMPFKATAGLHHPLRSRKPLTYDTDAPQATMHGFLNVFLAAAVATGGDRDEVLEMLRDDDPSRFAADDGTIRWSQASTEKTLGVCVFPDYDICEVRKFATSFGSCSFREPIDELHELGML
jgi:hypothetical protein